MMICRFLYFVFVVLVVSSGLSECQPDSAEATLAALKAQIQKNRVKRSAQEEHTLEKRRVTYTGSHCLNSFKVIDRTIIQADVSLSNGAKPPRRGDGGDLRVLHEVLLRHAPL